MINKLRYAALIVVLALSLEASAQMRRNEAFQEYINKYHHIAEEQQRRYKIPASITLAQGLLESGAGRSELAVKGNNHFGIKCHGWQGKKSYHNDDEQNECFRAYNSPRESYEDHSIFLSTSSRYHSLFDLRITDYKGWAHGLKRCGYATSPTYASKLIEIIELYNLNQYDKPSAHNHHSAYNDNNYVIYSHNHNYFVKARTGDTYKSIGRELGISARKLARYNERNKNDQLVNDEIVWLKKKRSKADKIYKKQLHTVKAGESIYSIAQLYGIKVKSLYKMNEMPDDYQLRVGDKLKVR